MKNQRRCYRCGSLQGWHAHEPANHSRCRQKAVRRWKQREKNMQLATVVSTNATGDEFVNLDLTVCRASGRGILKYRKWPATDWRRQQQAAEMNSKWHAS